MHTLGETHGIVEALFDTPYVTEPTRRVLQQRLAQRQATRPRYFDETTFALLRVVCARLVPQQPGLDFIDVAGAIDAQLAQGEGDGWRYADMPPGGAAHRLGLQGLDEVAYASFETGFVQLDAAQQDQVLLAIQRGEVRTGVWQTVPARRFFELLLTGATEAYYSHPLAQLHIGCVAMADAHGWHAVGLDQRQAPELLASGEHGAWRA